MTCHICAKDTCIEDHFKAEREWVDLTCEEVTTLIYEGAADGGWQGFATQVQDAFKEKNK